jgi:hypothetical protein
MSSSGILRRVALVSTDPFHNQGDKNRQHYVLLRTVLRLLLAANFVSKSPMLVILTMEATRSS